ncbi:hypothetical protein [Burkholderia glumae]|uniref:Uncharacterized protein n=1 Tax=Burkholderia glumae TaxID=337 RepID=A0AAP9XW78_BURGL|nr:hypothetical protein [Burkholderia glumae]MCM2485087.1 hypothetical protein [Burkholderia glumae]MCM2495440.1 hypothetical protein [Burkholderia glumae]MCM2510780.1 hypothetical protein [Burkholderia glumae]MCM2540616.1 hypothetical protein [Burkholderia glumae]MCM2546443.1 hypothetical protein [Burkholderia glumae]
MFSILTMRPQARGLGGRFPTRRRDTPVACAAIVLMEIGPFLFVSR